MILSLGVFYGAPSMMRSAMTGALVDSGGRTDKSSIHPATAMYGIIRTVVREDDGSYPVPLAWILRYLYRDTPFHKPKRSYV